MYVCYAIKQRNIMNTAVRKLVLSENVISEIKTDPLLWGQVAKALGLSPASMPRALRQDNERLTSASVMAVLRGYTKKSDKDLLIEKDI